MKHVAVSADCAMPGKRARRPPKNVAPEVKAKVNNKRARPMIDVYNEAYRGMKRNKDSSRVDYSRSSWSSTVRTKRREQSL